MANMQSRPLSPHLSIWRWQVTMAMSIMHRVTGCGVAFVGLPLFLWWLFAVARGGDSYACFLDFAHSPFGWIIGIGLTYGLFQHAMSGIRHFFMDVGLGYALGTARLTATLTFVGAALLTAVVWVSICVFKG